MKRFSFVTLFAVSLSVLAPICKAQDCGNWNNWDLRGTYAVSGSGWIDLSKLVPTLPAGSLPVAWVGVQSFNGRGGGTGWASVNAGGLPLSLELTNLSYDVKPDCSVAMTYSIKVKDVGTIGPVSRVSVIAAGSGLTLELFGILAGAGPGTGVESVNARRISMQFR